MLHIFRVILHKTLLNSCLQKSYKKSHLEMDLTVLDGEKRKAARKPADSLP